MVDPVNLTPIDLHIGKRLRRRRKIMGMTQKTLGESIGIRFQQIQKYECGANRVTASRLYELAVALNVPVNYFYEGLNDLPAKMTPEEQKDHTFASKLLAYYGRMNREQRVSLLSVARVIAHEEREPDADPLRSQS